MTPIICPRCGKDFVRRSHRSGFVEELLSVVYAHPFRCQLCGHRFRARRRGVRYYRLPVDRRQYERMAVQLPVALSGEAGEHRGATVDLSIVGCAVEAAGPLPEGSLWSIRLQAPQDPHPITVEAAVVRSTRANRAGLEFLRLAAGDKVRLGNLIFDLWRRRAALRSGRRAVTAAGGLSSPQASPRQPLEEA
jgi:hypothetical protein